MKPPHRATLYGTGLLLAFGAGWFFKPASSSGNAAALSDPALPSKRSGPPIPQKPTNALAAFGANGLEAASVDIVSIRAAMRPGVVNQVLIDKLQDVLSLKDKFQRLVSWQSLMLGVRSEDVPAVREMLTELSKQGRLATEELQSLLQHWGKLDGATAAQSFAALPFPDEELRSVMTGWGQQDSNAALAWLKSQDKKFVSCNRVLWGLFEGIASTGPDATEAVLLKHASEPEFQIVLGKVAQIRIQQEGLTSAIAWFGQMAAKPLPDEYKKENLRVLTQFIQQLEAVHGN